MDVASVAFWLEVSDTENARTLWQSFLKGYGIETSEEINQEIRYHIVIRQAIIMLFLQEYITLDEKISRIVYNDAKEIVDKALNDKLSVILS